MLQAVRYRWRRLVGSALLVGGFGVTIVIAFVGSAHKPASRPETVLLAVLAGALQLGAAWFFFQEGRAGPQLVSASTRRLIGMAALAERAAAETQAMFENKPAPTAMHAGMGRATVMFSVLAEAALHTVQDWRSVQPEVVDEIVRGIDAGTD